MKATNYDSDFYTWTQQQAALLKAGRFSEVDIENIVEEIETMGRSERRELESRMSVLLAHLLKWQYQSERRTRSWQLTIEEQRLKFSKVLAENPGLKPQFPTILADAYQFAVVRCMKETKFQKSVFPAQCPWTVEQIADRSFFPG
jgi:hypothetical protein